MKLGYKTDSVRHLSQLDAMDLAQRLGFEHIEFATGGWSTSPHIDVDLLLEDPAARERFQENLASRGLSLSALNCSGNPLHPGPQGEAHNRTTRRTIELAALLGVERIVMMSGLPAAPGDNYPNWITVSWPPEAGEILEYQWQEVVLPYWRELVPFASDHGIEKLALELHGHQIVYNVPGFRRLRDAVGPTVGVNFDPSHLFWMGADTIAAIRALGDAIYHVHAKDTRIEARAAENTLLETVALGHNSDASPTDRAWNYVTVGDGHDQTYWDEFVATLRSVGYDDVLSIEHEDASVDPVEGLVTTAERLRNAFAI